MTSPSNAPVDICNKALRNIGQRQQIQSIDSPENTIAETLAAAYDDARRVLLRDYVWNFAQRYEAITRSGDGDAGYEDKFFIPVDCLRINNVGTDRLLPPVAYEIIDGYIHADNGGDSLGLWFNTDVTSVGAMDVSFVELLSWRIAVDVALAITQKDTVVDRAVKELTAREPKAKGVDGQERPPLRRQTSKYMAARRGFNRTNRDTSRFDV